MSGFVRFADRCPEYVAAVNALCALAACEHGPEPDQAIGEALREYHRELWQKKGYRRSSGHACIARLVSRRCRAWSEEADADEVPPCHPPGADHSSLWLKDGKPAVFLTEPYGLTFRDAEALVLFAWKYGLTFRIDTDPGLHYPGRTLSILVTRAMDIRPLDDVD